MAVILSLFFHREVKEAQMLKKKEGLEKLPVSLKTG